MKFANVSVWICLAFTLLGLSFRSTLYWKFRVTPGDPYGGGDILDAGLFLISAIFALLAIITALVRLAISYSTNLRHSAKTIAYVLGILVFYYNVHVIMPRLM